MGEPKSEPEPKPEPEPEYVDVPVEEAAGYLSFRYGAHVLAGCRSRFLHEAPMFADFICYVYEGNHFSFGPRQWEELWKPGTGAAGAPTHVRFRRPKE